MLDSTHRPGRWLRGGSYLGLPVIALAVVVQGTLLSRVHLVSAQPDLLLSAVICWSLLRGVTSGILVAFVAGLGIDAISGGALGMSALALMPTAFLSSIGRRRVFSNNVLLPVLLVAIATPLHGWTLLLIRQAAGVNVDWLSATLRVILPRMLLNGLLTVVLYPLLTLLAGRTEAGSLGR